MDTLTLQIPREKALELLPDFERRRTQLEAELKMITSQIALIRGDTPLPPRRGRSKKPETESAIRAYLGTLPANVGASIRQIAKDTGVSYATTHRMITALKAQSEVIEKDGKWLISPI